MAGLKEEAFELAQVTITYSGVFAVSQGTLDT
jgi:hypothetical protein